MSLLKVAGTTASSGTLYVDDVFSVYLYTGNGSTQTITNGIDLAGEGGLVWGKSRNNAGQNYLIDTVRGPDYGLISNTTGANSYDPDRLTDFNSNGFSVGTSGSLNTNGDTYASWTFREAAKFFDVVTYTGTGSARTIAHSLGIAPGMIIVKRTDASANWQVYSNGLTSAAYSIVLNDSVGQTSAPTVWNSTAPTSSVFSVGTDATVNASGGTYVAYLYAHDTDADGIIQCGSYATNASYVGPNVNLGFEPAWILVKKANGNGAWSIVDTMRGWTTDGNVVILNPNSSSDESTTTQFKINATGFQDNGAFSANATMIYMAIRMPNKPPTSGTQVFSPVARTGNSPTVTSITSPGFAPDAVWEKRRSPDTAASNFFDKLRGRFFLSSATTTAETAANTTATRDLVSFDNLGFTVGEQWSSELNANTKPEVYWNFKRAPGFFDEVCYTGTGVARTVAHNLTVVPELIITKCRSTGRWPVWVPAWGNVDYFNYLELTQGPSNRGWDYITATTSTTYSLGADSSGYTNTNTNNYVAYLFATLAGISKVGSYTGNGTSQNIECGFAAGARFFLVKATSTTGSWWVWDSARGITSGNDPALQLNSTAAEITTADAVDPYSPGITVNQEATCSINASGVSYVYLAIS